MGETIQQASAADMRQTTHCADRAPICTRNPKLFVLFLLANLTIHSTAHAAEVPTNFALRKTVKASSALPEYPAANAVDGSIDDSARWLSVAGKGPHWLIVQLDQAATIRQAHVYSGWEYQSGSAIRDGALEVQVNGRWRTIPGATFTSNSNQQRALNFKEPVTTDAIRFVSRDAGPVRLREIALWEQPQPLGTGVAADRFPRDQHLIALNQVGYETARYKRFTAPLSPEGSQFEIRHVGSAAALFRGVLKNCIGDFTAFRPADSDREYVVFVSGRDLKSGASDPFSIRAHLWEEQFWQPAVDFMIDVRSVVGTHPSAYGGCPWRDGTYYDFIVPSLAMLLQADPARVKAMPVQMNWAQDKARVLSSEFRFDARNPHSEGVMDAVKCYYTEIEPPKPGAPDVVQLIHWGLGYYLCHPETRDPSGDPLPKQLHPQTLEQFVYLLHAWPELKMWLPESFYRRCRDFTFANWEKVGLLKVSPMWDAKTYLTVAELSGPNPTGGFLHPYKGRHAPGHSIQPNLMLSEVAKREGRVDARKYLDAAVEQAQWIVENLDWNDPRTTKGHRMSEFKTITGLVWLLQKYPKESPAGLLAKIEEWARIVISRSDNMWDFRRFDLQENWTIPKLNEPGNLASFVAEALAASWVIRDPATKQRLQEMACAQLDNLIGRNPRMAASPHHPEKGFPLVERGWPKGHPDNICARLETTRGSLSASPGSEMYPFNPGGAFRHAEGWVNFNAAWNVALAYLKWDFDQAR